MNDEPSPQSSMADPEQGPAGKPSLADLLVPSIPEQELLRCIGRGSYGEVWLSRTVTGLHRAVKVIRRDRFESDRPMEREFAGLKYFEKICLTHPGLVALLQVGRNTQAGYFYYVMEIADDLVFGPNIDPEHYRPKTIRSMLGTRGRFSAEQCFEIGITLAASLAHLQRHGLIHRDVKPSNIILVHEVPKFADIGLVTKMGEPASWVGTLPYTPQEGPGGPTSDIYGMGRVLYEMCTGLAQSRFPELPPDLIEGREQRLVLALNHVILKACAQNPLARYQSAEDFQADLMRSKTEADRLTETHTAASTVPPQYSAQPTPGQSPGLYLLYKSNFQQDAALAAFLRQTLSERGWRIHSEPPRSGGLEWVREIESQIQASEAVIALVSKDSAQSEMIAYQLELAWQLAEQQSGKPRIIPIAIANPGPVFEGLSRFLTREPLLTWNDAGDNQALREALEDVLAGAGGQGSHSLRPILETTGGAVPLDSRYYVKRPSDLEFNEAIARADSIVLVKGARQIGKTSLLARGLQHARQLAKHKVALTDFQKLDANHLASSEALYLKLADVLADQFDLPVLPGSVWDSRRSPNTNFERYMRREVLAKIEGHLYWGMDEVDRLFGCPFANEVFGLFRSWHNERALDPSGPWTRLTLVIAYATEAHLFITDINQSPFNVGTRLRLDDFTVEQIMDLNARYSNPLSTLEQIQQLHLLTGGHPYLVRHALNELAAGHLTFDEFARKADCEEGLFGDHLRRILVLLAREKALSEIIVSILSGRPCHDATSFYRLRSAGIMSGDAPGLVRPRCRIYQTYLQRNLLGSPSA